MQELKQYMHLPSAVATRILKLMQQWHLAGEIVENLMLAFQVAHSTRRQALREMADVTLVWTGPTSAPVAVRDTQNVLSDLIESAKTEIVVVGYALTEGAAPILKMLSNAYGRGVRVVIIGNRLKDKLAVLRQYWPVNTLQPELFTYPESSTDSKAALHAKLVAVDQKRMLVTSANLTYHGLTGNIEIGLAVNGKVVADTILLLNELIARKFLIRVTVEA